jgi:hypothetical protein
LYILRCKRSERRRSYRLNPSLLGGLTVLLFIKNGTISYQQSEPSSHFTYFEEVSCDELIPESYPLLIEFANNCQ